MFDETLKRLADAKPKPVPKTKTRMVRELLRAGAVGALAAAVLALVLAWFYGLRAALHRNPDAPFRWLVAANRWQAAWFKDQLDDVGLRYRSRGFNFMKAYLVAMLLFLGCAYLANI